MRGDVTDQYMVEQVARTEDGQLLWVWRPRYLGGGANSEPMLEAEAHAEGRAWGEWALASQAAIDLRARQGGRQRRRR